MFIESENFGSKSLPAMLTCSKNIVDLDELLLRAAKVFSFKKFTKITIRKNHPFNDQLATDLLIISLFEKE